MTACANLHRIPRQARRSAGPAAIGRTLLVCASLAATAPAFAQTADPEVVRDFGAGIIAFEFPTAPDVSRLPRADTMIVYERPAVGAEIAARFIFVIPEPMNWTYILETEEDELIGNRLEFGYEEDGLPVDSLSMGGDWARVIYAMDREGTPRSGWVRLEPGRFTVDWWSDILPGRPLFLLDPGDRIALRDRPGGEAVPFEPARDGTGPQSRADYRFDPLEIEGRWMRVRLVTPDDGCTSDPLPTRTATGWIEFLNDRGRPRVWYHTRGC